MDEFLREINISVYKEWILNQNYKNNHISIQQIDNDTINITAEYGQATIIFNDFNIIELQVINTVNNDVEFYLHFQMKTMKHAVELFNEMLECLKKLVHKPVTKILLSCSGGLTTSYFASKMNEASRLLFLNYNVDAIGYTHLFDVGGDYDIIMLAPQISYMKAKVQEILKDQIVINIPPQVFAKYDVGKNLAIIQDAFNHRKPIKETEKKPLSLQTAIDCHTEILSLSIFRNSNRVHIAYRLYGKKQDILLNKEIIKEKISIQTIQDVIDTVLIQYPNIKIIGISIPGIISKNTIFSSSINGITHINIHQITERYSQKIIFGNDVNTAAVGYYASQNEYKNLTVLFQPTNFIAGAGSIINGQLIQGKSNLAGEVQYLPLKSSDRKLILSKTPEGALELVSQMVLSIMSIIDPEAIILFCTLIPHVDELIKELEKSIEKEYIPKIIKIEDLAEYCLLGQMILCAQTL